MDDSAYRMVKPAEMTQNSWMFTQVGERYIFLPIGIDYAVVSHRRVTASVPKSLLASRLRSKFGIAQLKREFCPPPPNVYGPGEEQVMISFRPCAGMRGYCTQKVTRLASHRLNHSLMNITSAETEWGTLNRQTFPMIGGFGLLLVHLIG
ncbi:hypothetical protein J6590_044277 [Homalodisca vitripennis]|nr:hypothetical protein J6590_044277 [Homalodisca vitripennis]